MILDHPMDKYQKGALMPLPSYLKQYIAAWAKVEYRQYDYGYQVIQSLHTSQFRIWMLRFKTEQNIVVYPFFEESSLTLQYTLQGYGKWLLQGHGKQALEPSNYELLYVPAGKSEVCIEKGVYESLLIEIDASYLKHLSQKHPDILDALSRLQAGSPDALAVPRAMMNKNIRSILNEIRVLDGPGEILELLLHSSIYKLLSIYDDQITAAAALEARRLSLCDKTLASIHAYIIENPDIHECAIGVLSIQFRISQENLKKHFKKKHGITLYQFVVQQCMEKAKMLLQETSNTINSITAELGYGDKSNFCKAFKQYHGCLPTEMRRQDAGSTEQ